MLDCSSGSSETLKTGSSGGSCKYTARRVLGAIAVCGVVLGLTAALSLYQSRSLEQVGQFQPQIQIPASARVLRCGFYVLRVSPPDMEDRAFSIDVYLWLAQPVKTKKPAPSEPNTEGNVVASATETTSPEDSESFLKFEVMNGEVESQAEMLREKDGSELVATWRVKARCHGEFLFTNYPFDTQVLQFAIEHPDYETEDVVLVPDLRTRSSDPGPQEGVSPRILERGLYVPGWNIKRCAVRSLVHHYDTDFGMASTGSASSEYSRLELSIEVQRDYYPFLLKVLIPLVLVITVAYLVSFLYHDELEASAGIIVTSMLATIALHLAEASNLGDVGYLITIDKFFIFNYLCLLALFAETVATHVCFRISNNLPLADFIDQATRWLFPPVYLLGVVLILWRAVG